MKLLVISGSRNPKGQTAAAADALIRGATNAGWKAEQMFLPTMEVERCRQCDDSGWGICRTEGKCVIDDDFAGIAERIGQADAVVFATPVYFSDLSESLKALLDRLRRTCMQEKGIELIEGTPAIGICVAGGGGGGAPACTVSLEKVLRTCGFDVLDLIPVRRQNAEIKLPLLEATGKWLAERTPTP